MPEETQPTVTMNAWLIEKTSRIMTATANLRKWQENEREGPSEAWLNRSSDSVFANMTWEQFCRDAQMDAVCEIYRMAAKLLAYSLGDFPPGLEDRIRASLKGGPEAMETLVEHLQASGVMPGWDMPNPNFHSLYVPIDRPKPAEEIQANESD